MGYALPPKSWLQHLKIFNPSLFPLDQSDFKITRLGSCFCDLQLWFPSEQKIEKNLDW